AISRCFSNFSGSREKVNSTWLLGNFFKVDFIDRFLAYKPHNLTLIFSVVQGKRARDVKVLSPCGGSVMSPQQCESHSSCFCATPCGPCSRFVRPGSHRFWLCG